MKKNTLYFLLLFTLTAFAQDKVLYESLGDVGKGSSENGWVLEDVAFSLNVIRKYNYEGQPAKKVYWYDGNGKVTYKMQGYQYKGEYYSKSKLYEIIGQSVFARINYEVSFNRLFTSKNGSSDGSSANPFNVWTGKKSSPENINDLNFANTKITQRSSSGVENDIERYLQKQKKDKKKEKEKPKEKSNDNFWDGGEEKTTETKKIKIKTESNDNFWSGESTTTNTDSDDAFWSGEKKFINADDSSLSKETILMETEIFHKENPNIDKNFDCRYYSFGVRDKNSKEILLKPNRYQYLTKSFHKELSTTIYFATIGIKLPCRYWDDYADYYSESSANFEEYYNNQEILNEKFEVINDMKFHLITIVKSKWRFTFSNGSPFDQENITERPPKDGYIVAQRAENVREHIGRNGRKYHRYENTLYLIDFKGNIIKKIPVGKPYINTNFDKMVPYYDRY